MDGRRNPVTPMNKLTAAELARIYDSAAKGYNCHYSELPVEERDWLSRIIDRRPSPRVILDAGAGTGLCSQFVNSLINCRGAHKISLDLSSEMLKADRNHGLSVVADYRCLPIGIKGTQY